MLGELVGFDCFYVGRLQGARDTIWQLTAIDMLLILRLGRADRRHEPVSPTAQQSRASRGASQPTSGRRLAARAAR